jgi:uncharacterized protein
VSWLLRVILLLVVVRALWRLLRGVFEGAGYGEIGSNAPQAVKLVRDPICGVYVAPGKALVARAAGETAYFCSERCRDKWEKR